MFLDELPEKIKEITLDDINWVLTVPAIRDDKAKEFMAMAAEEAGKPEKSLILVYEPEAAALFCKHTPFSKEALSGRDESIFSEGSKFMILDLGGGTIDITSHEVNCDGRLEALVEPSGGPWGGVLVDANWYKLFEELFGSDVVIELCEDFTEKLDLDRLIELKKRVIQPSDAELTRIKLPSVLFDIFAEKNEHVSFHEKLKDRAVIFGHCQNFIMSHKLPNSYGVSTNVPFDVNIQREDFKVKERDGSLMCFDVFHPLVRKGEKIVVKETTITKEFRSHRPGMSRVSVDIYKTLQDI
ncbi:heat shock 70 kDa protein 12A-like [Mya arenaria]|uniref:heat shock 70 kDa protein 12A-like n=1 Tax=Mya arenaria TaxID=6604 RepID=UPI0022DFD7AF|nr:heat shock 70 kDa protein 12A-like [Mya arenaria]